MEKILQRKIRIGTDTTILDRCPPYSIWISAKLVAPAAIDVAYQVRDEAEGKIIAAGFHGLGTDSSASGLYPGYRVTVGAELQGDAVDLSWEVVTRDG